MNVVVLAAGLGSRLGTLTRDLPKALIPVAGKPLLLHAVSFAARLRPSRIIVVGGFCFQQVKETLHSFRAGDPAAASIQLVENASFRDGNLVSLLTAKPLITEGFLVMNVDHIYRPSIAEVVTPEVGAVTAFIDTDRTLGNDDMKVERGADGRIVSIAKTLTKFDCGYVGMSRVPTAMLGRYFEEADRALAEEGRAIHVERILGRLAQTSSKSVSEKATIEISDAEACPAGPSAKSALSLWERERVREISPSPRALLPVGEGKSPGYDSTSPFQTSSKTDLAPACRDISGHGWLEVDTPDERAAAEATLAAGRWA